MPIVTTLIDDKSPLIFYDDSWLPGSSAWDPFADQYYLGTWTSNNVTNGQVVFKFNGTGFWIYGAKRNNHGTFSVNIDGSTYGNNSGYSGPAEFMQVLFNQSGLSQSMHTVTLTNTGTDSQYVGIDLFVWQSEIGNSDDQLITETVEDTDPRFQYQGSTWSTNFDTNFFSDGTVHYTQTYQATATFTFTGDVVTLFGASGTQTGPYSLQLDGGEAVKYNSTAFRSYYNVPFYHADNLGPGDHQLLITNLPDASGQSLIIDYALVSSLVGSGGSSGTTPGISSATTSNQLSAGMIAGIVVPSVTAALALLAAFLFYRKWKASEIAHNHLYSVHATQQPQLAPIAFSASLQAGHQPASSSGHHPSNTGSTGLRNVQGSDTTPWENIPASVEPVRSSDRSNLGSISPFLETRAREPPDSRSKLAGSSDVNDRHSPIPSSDSPPNYTQVVENDRA